jgi:hypothetical protein
MYLLCGRYGMQIARYLEYFPRERFHILRWEDLRDRRAETLAGVFRFLGVDDAFRSPAFEDTWNVTSGKTEVDEVGRFLARCVRRTPLARLPRKLRARFAFVYRPFILPVRRPALGEAIRCRLREFYRDDLSRFEALTGVRVGTASGSA